MRNFVSNSQQFNERKITRNQESFAKGAYDDILATSVPSTGIKYLENYIAFNDRLEPRAGTQKWSTATLPPLSGRTGYSFTKSGTIVTKTVGDDFISADKGNYIVYDDGTHEQISYVISATQVTVLSDTIHVASTAGYVRGQVRGFYYHRTKEKVILHIDSRLFLSDNLIFSWTQIYGHSDVIGDSTSTITERDDFVTIINANGIFNVDLGIDTPIYFRINGQVLQDNITNIDETDDLTYGYRYLVTLSRFSGNDDKRRMALASKRPL